MKGKARRSTARRAQARPQARRPAPAGGGFKDLETWRTMWGNMIPQHDFDAMKAAGGLHDVHLLAPSFVVWGTHWKVHAKDFSIRNVWLQGMVHPTLPEKTLFASRIYDAQDVIVSKCLVSDIPRQHGLYWNTCGNVRVEDTEFRNIASQAIQFGFRDKPPYEMETINPAWMTNPGTHEMLNVRCFDCTNLDGEMSAATLSFFECGQAVFIDGCRLEHVNHKPWDYNGFQYASFGAIVAEDRPSVVIQNTVIDYVKPNRPIVQVARVGSVALSGLAVREGLVRIKDCNTVSVRDCTGDALLEVDGNVIGPLSKGYSS